METEGAGIKAVCWDWNGTLLNDVAVARASMNAVLRGRALAVLPDDDSYRRIFGFPIRDFYSRLGLGEAVFTDAADDYLELFAEAVQRAPLQPDAMTTLTDIAALGVDQVLISATPMPVLLTQMAPHAVAHHFSRILGITDVYAASKLAVVESWLHDAGYKPRSVLMVGDTNHDEEIAEALDVQFLRFGGGHQHRVERSQHPVIDSLRDVVSYIRSAMSDEARHTL